METTPKKLLDQVRDVIRRHHIHESSLQKVVRSAAHWIDSWCGDYRLPDILQDVDEGKKRLVSQQHFTPIPPRVFPPNKKQIIFDNLIPTRAGAFPSPIFSTLLLKVVSLQSPALILWGRCDLSRETSRDFARLVLTA